MGGSSKAGGETIWVAVSRLGGNYLGSSFKAGSENIWVATSWVAVLRLGVKLLGWQCEGWG